MRYRAMAVTAAAVTAGLTLAACSAGGSAAGSPGAPAASPRHTGHLDEPATVAAVRADAADYLSLASAGQYAVTYQMLSAGARRAISQQAWVAVHQICTGASYQLKHVTVAGQTATVAVALTGAKHPGTLTETLVYSGGAWGFSPRDLSLYQHSTVAADVVAARAQGSCAS